MNPTRQKELKLLQEEGWCYAYTCEEGCTNRCQKVPPEDDYEYEKFFRKHILPIEVKKAEEKNELIKNYCRQVNMRVPNYTYDPLDDEVSLESDSSLEEENKIKIKNIGKESLGKESLGKKEKEVDTKHESPHRTAPQRFRIVPHRYRK